MRLLVLAFSLATVSLAAEVPTKELRFKKVETNLLVKASYVAAAERITLHDKEVVGRLYGHPEWYRVTVGMSSSCEDCENKNHHIITLYVRLDRHGQIIHQFEVDLESRTVRIADEDLH